MITGIGTDIEKWDRFVPLICKESFLKKVYTPEEISYLESRKKGSAQSACAIFCAKEAFSKAIGTGLTPSLLQNVSVLHSNSGKPYFRFEGEFEQYREKNVQLSLSHCSDYAIAFVVIEEPSL